MIHSNFKRGAAALSLALASSMVFATSDTGSRQGVTFSLDGGEDKVKVVATDFRLYHDSDARVPADGLQPYFFRDGSNFYGRQPALVPLIAGASFFLQTNPEIVPVFLVRGLPADQGAAERKFDEVVYCPAGATAVAQCAKPRRVEFVVNKAGAVPESTSKTGYRFEYKLFAVMDRTGSRTIRFD